MTGTDQLSRIAPYLGRLLEDEYVQKQIGQAITALRRSSRRASSRSPTEVLKDKQIRGQLRVAMNSLSDAGHALKQPAPPKRHLARRTILLAGVCAGVALAWRACSTSNDRTNN